MTYLLLFGSAVLMVNALVGENGYLASVNARREYDRMEAELTKLRQENRRLFDEQARLKTDPAALEEAARRELGLVRPGEKLIIIHDVPPATSAPR